MRPILDAIEVYQPTRDVSSFLAGQEDEFLARDGRDAEAIRAASADGITEFDRFEGSPVLSTFSIAGPPWNDPKLRLAISAALNRAELARRLFAGRAAACGPVSPATPQFALDEVALAGVGGYGADPAKDAADARTLWNTAGGPALGTVVVDFPSIFDPLYSASAIVTGMLNEVLGDQFRASVETYTTISQKVADGTYGNGQSAFWFGWGAPLRSPDPTREFVEAFDARANGSGAASSQSSRLGELFDAMLNEADASARQALVRDAGVRLLVEASAVIPWLLQRSELFRWRRLTGAAATPFWTQHLDALSSVDRTAGGG